MTLPGCGKKQPDTKSASAASLAQPPVFTPSEPVSPAARVPEPPSHSLAAGTVVPVRLASVVDSSMTFNGFIMGQVDADVKGADGQLAIPAGSQIAMLVRESNKSGPISTLRIGLYTINIAGHQHALSNGVRDAATVVLTEDAGRGPSHSSVHLQYGSHLDFKLDAPVQLR